MHEAAQIHHLDPGLPAPFGVAIDVLGDKDHVSRLYPQALVEVDVGSLPREDHAEAGLSSVAVALFANALSIKVIRVFAGIAKFAA